MENAKLFETLAEKFISLHTEKQKSALSAIEALLLTQKLEKNEHNYLFGKMATA
jgi:hypothetical protein